MKLFRFAIALFDDDCYDPEGESLENTKKKKKNLQCEFPTFLNLSLFQMSRQWNQMGIKVKDVENYWVRNSKTSALGN